MQVSTRKPLRLWPAVILVILLLLSRFVAPLFGSQGLMYGMFFGGFALSVAMVLWWLFFSRAPWSERLGAIVLMIAAFFVTRRLLDKSIATGGMGFLFPMFGIPALCTAFGVWAIATARLSNRVRRLTMVATILLATGVWALIRTGGFTYGDFHNDFHWRWTPTPEDRVVARNDLPPTPPPAPPAPAEIPEKPVSKPLEAPAAKKPSATPVVRPVAERKAEWPGFRGPNRDDVVPGVRIKTDWSASPPVALWRRPVGPGWSSFAVRGDMFYTQEQRGPDEVVACYRLKTGEPVWAHRDTARFWESNGGPGPRGTPTLSNDRVYAFGATGIVNALNADDGAVMWSRNAASETGMKVPEWGFASSPLVVGNLVIVAAAGRLVAYDRASGAPRWLGPSGGGVSYSSPQLATIDGVDQVLLLSGPGATSVSPSDGKLLWQHAWKGYPIVQPAGLADGNVLISVSDSSGIRRLAVTRGSADGAGGWSVQERWTSRGLKPYFNDFVVHKGHAFGFDGSILSCIDLNDGTRKWKGGRYGSGQLVLLADQDVLLVVSEEGELALVRATPDQFTELARVPGIEGKTWNHPVLVGDVLLVRNGAEMAAFRLARQD